MIALNHVTTDASRQPASSPAPSKDEQADKRYDRQAEERHEVASHSSTSGFAVTLTFKVYGLPLTNSMSVASS